MENSIILRYNILIEIDACGVLVIVAKNTHGDWVRILG